MRPLSTLPFFHHYLNRLMRSGLAFCLLVLGSLAVGVLGYRFTEGMRWIDALENASMILSGMGPANDMKTDAGKLFASFYALYSGLFLIAVTGAMLLPILHVMMAHFHIKDNE